MEAQERGRALRADWGGRGRGGGAEAAGGRGRQRAHPPRQDAAGWMRPGPAFRLRHRSEMTNGPLLPSPLKAPAKVTFGPVERGGRLRTMARTNPVGCSSKLKGADAEAGSTRVPGTRWRW